MLTEEHIKDVYGMVEWFERYKKVIMHSNFRVYSLGLTRRTVRVLLRAPLPSVVSGF